MAKLSVMFREASNRLQNVLNIVQEQAQLREPERLRTVERVFSLQKIADALGVTPSYINQLSKSNENWPAPVINNNRRIGWHLEEFLMIREIVNRCPFTEEQKAVKKAVVLAIANFKGGSAKTTSSVILSQGLCLRGYKVLIIDIDPQASNTYQWSTKDKTDDKGYTLGDYMLSDKKGDDYIHFRDAVKMPPVESLVKSTHWPNIDIIKSDPSLHLVEIGLAKKVGQYSEKYWEKLKIIIETIKNTYDLVLIDFPPSLNFSATNGLFCANGTIVPCPPEVIDLVSTEEFFSVGADLFQKYEEFGNTTDFKMLKMLMTKTVNTDGFKKEIEYGTKLHMRDFIFNTGLLNSDVYGHTTKNHTTAYEVHDYHDKNSLKRCIENLDLLVDEVEKDLHEIYWSEI